MPSIPLEELDASAVEFPHNAVDGKVTVAICKGCYDAYKSKNPTLSKTALSNFLWLGRHHPLLREASHAKSRRCSGAA